MDIIIEVHIKKEDSYEKQILQTFCIIIGSRHDSWGGITVLAEEPVTLTLWTSYNAADETSNYAEWFAEAKAKFEEAYPNVTIEEVCTPDGEDYLTKVTAELAAGNAPDLFRTWLTGRLEPFATAGYVHGLNELVDGSEVLSDNVSEQAKGYSKYGDDTYYAIPMIASSEIVFYNKAIFAECGVEIPTTLDEFYAACEAIEAKGYTAIAMGAADAWFSSIPYMTIFQRLDADDEVYNAVCVDNECRFTDDIFVEAAEEYLKMAEYFNDNASAIACGEAISMYQNGEAAMIFDGTWDIASHVSALGEDAGCFNLPGYDGPSTEFLMNYDEGWSIGANTEHADLCIAFYEILFGDEMQAKYAEEGNLIACQNVEYDSSLVPTLTAEVSELLATAETTNIPWDNPLGTNMGNEFNVAVQTILSGGDPAETFAALNDTAEFEWE